MIPITIWIVEDDAAFRRSLQQVLSREEHITCNRVFSSCTKLFETIKTDSHPNLILMDLGLPGMGGVEGIQKLALLAPDIAVLVLTVFEDKDKVLQSLDAGAVGYLLKTSMPHEIIQGIKDVFLGGAALSPSVAKMVLEEMHRPKSAEKFDLSERELEVLASLATGLSSKLIADELEISYNTVCFHLRNIYAKLEVQSKSSAIAKAFRSGLV